MKSLPLLLTLMLATSALADPQLTAWFTANTGKYAQIYTNSANRTSEIASTTWSTQTLPTYAGVHEIDYSSNWVYIKNTGLSSFIMGPWNNPNWAKNQGTSTTVYRFPRGIAGVTNTPANKTLTNMGAIGFLADGVAIYNTSDGYSYSVSHDEDASPVADIGTGDGIWNRDAWVNEFSSFDYALNHPQQQGQYHSHADPIASRYLLGDNVAYNSSTKQYSEITNTAVTAHSPLIGWLNDGLPLYGPYGYSDPTNAASGVRLMVSGYVLRNGEYGTTNLGVTGRTTLPEWAVVAQGKASNILSTDQWGPATNYTTTAGPVTTTYVLGHYAEDYDYLGSLGYTQGITNGDGTFFDLNQYNARWCVTPDYPNGTWAYFVSILPNGTPWYPYMVGRWFMGNPTGGTTNTATMNADTPLTLYFKGATNLQEELDAPAINAANGDVTLVWSALQGGTYQIVASPNLSTWTNLTPAVTATNNTAGAIEIGDATGNTNRFYKIARTGVAAFDSTGY